MTNVSKKISKLRDEGKPQDQAVAIAPDMASRKGRGTGGGDGYGKSDRGGGSVQGKALKNMMKRKSKK